MRQPPSVRPIWETASRPLFVRSVWLQETASTGRSHRRHFILDYEPRERKRWQHSLAASGARRAEQQTHSNELCEDCIGYNDSVDSLDDYLLLDATKLTLQQQEQLQSQNSSAGGQCKTSTPKASRHAKRRAWLLSRGKTYYSPRYARQQLEHYSRRSSLQDLQSTLLGSQLASNPEQRLAERVLNWLDLAGHTDMLKTTDTPAVLGSSQRGQRRMDGSGEARQHAAAKRQANRATTSQARKPCKLVQQQTSHSAGCRIGNAKPLTIIFNKEGVPVRLNRPARNIDLCALSSSASTTRRLAGQLASARLYNSTAAPTAPRAHEAAADTPPCSNRAMHAHSSADCKKQLHIFMPSLPKKGLLMTASSEDGLSAAFSELCQI